LRHLFASLISLIPHLLVSYERGWQRFDGCAHRQQRPFKRHPRSDQEWAQWLAVNLSREHGTLLAKFSIVYKGILLALHNIFKCKQPWHFFIAGAVGGWFVWGSKFDTINSTVALYMFSRAIFGLCVHLHRNHALANPFGDKIFAAFCALSWGIGMGLFELKPSALNISLVRSQEYIYHQSDHWNSIWDFLPTWKQN
jgi:hypothetical protein